MARVSYSYNSSIRAVQVGGCGGACPPPPPQTFGVAKKTSLESSFTLNKLQHKMCSGSCNVIIGHRVQVPSGPRLGV